MSELMLMSLLSSTIMLMPFSKMMLMSEMEGIFELLEDGSGKGSCLSYWECCLR